MAITTLDAGWHLRAEVSRLLACLEEYLRRQRTRGRTPAADAVRGFVIEDGEAEGLLAELTLDWGNPARASAERIPPHPSAGSELAELSATVEAQGAYLPLRHAARAFQLTSAEYDAVLLALAAEIDARFGRLFAYLNDHVGHTRPTMGLAVGLTTSPGGRKMLSPLEVINRPLVRDGLIDVEGDGPAPGRALRMTEEMARRLVESRRVEPASGDVAFTPPEIGLLDRLVLADSVRDALDVWTAEAREQPETFPCLVLAGSRGSGRSTVARAAASAAGRSLVSVELQTDALGDRLRTARREARWYDAAILLVVNDPKIHWGTLWSGLEGPAPLVFLCVSPEAVEEATRRATRRTSVLSLPEPDAELRKRLWQKLLPPGTDLEPAALEALASSFRYNAGRMAEVVRRAQSESTLRAAGKRRLTGEALCRAARAVGRGSMATLAQKLPCPYSREELVVPPPVREELDLALAWVRRQYKVLADWGFQRRLPFGQGLSALFSGPSGTGKTMAAQVLARELELDLYRIDLSRVVSKYIGETEKNLARLFDEAHQSGAILFFDEADALFGKRSEVRDAHDRYANIEIGYLLQRMEEHDGVIILATNRRGDMDEAFTRRFDVSVDFPMPDQAARLRIWQGMFPAEAEREEALDLAPLAHRFELSGGEIRNTVLAAAYLAADRAQPIGMRHLKLALRRELFKSGRVIDESELNALHG